MTIDTTKLRELAQKSTPGPWQYFEHPKYKEHHVTLPIEGSSMRIALFSDGCETSNPAADAEYIAAANPAVVLSLLDEIDRLREMLKYAVKEADGWHDELRGCPIENDPKFDEISGYVEALK